MEPLTAPGRDTHREGRDMSRDATQKADYEQHLDWLDNQDQLDLRLALHDYAAQLQTSRPLPDPPQSAFRRRLSFTKLSLGRSSVTSSRPATKDSIHPSQPPPPLPHARRKSWTLSILTLAPVPAPALAPQASQVSSIDASAAHYQDPEARSKLRAYLASPQKFDEALEFGFAPRELRSPRPPEELPVVDMGLSSGTFRTNTLKTFFEDGASSLYSVSDSESPRTPHTPDTALHAIRPLRQSGNVVTLPSKLSDGQALQPTASREMTLRMTLTRPDLRSCNDELTVWHKSSNHRYPDRSSQSLHSRSDTPDPTLSLQDTTRESMAKVFADIDQELHATSGGRVKRFWTRVVRRG